MRIEDCVPEDSGSVSEHKKALQEEMKKAKPRDVLLLQLMKNTFHDRRMFIQNEAAAVADILEQYPALARPTVVSNSECILQCLTYILYI